MGEFDVNVVVVVGVTPNPEVVGIEDDEEGDKVDDCPPSPDVLTNLLSIFTEATSLTMTAIRLPCWRMCCKRVVLPEPKNPDKTVMGICRVRCGRLVVELMVRDKAEANDIK